MSKETEVFNVVIRAIDARRDKQRGILVGIDGPDGSGKSKFAQNLAVRLRKNNTPVLHVSIDDFHRPRTERYIRGRHSPEGFFRDSYDYETFKSSVLIPFMAAGDRYVRTAAHNVDTDEQLSPEPVLLSLGTILIVDGIFLHRDELKDYWGYSIFLDVDFQQTFQRMAVRDNCSPNPSDQANHRYREGQRLYFKECSPKSRATVVVDNNDFQDPKIISSTLPDYL